MVGSRIKYEGHDGRGGAHGYAGQPDGRVSQTERTTVVGVIGGWSALAQLSMVIAIRTSPVTGENGWNCCGRGLRMFLLPCMAGRAVAAISQLAA